MASLALEHPLLLGAALLLVLHRLGRRLYNAYLAEEPELYFLPTGLNRARPAASATAPGRRPRQPGADAARPRAHRRSGRRGAAAAALRRLFAAR